MPNQRDPRYRHHKARDLAVVRIDGKDYYLGRYGSEESRLKYHRLLADWRAGLLSKGDSEQKPAEGNLSRRHDITIVEIVAKYWEFAKEYYQKDDEFTQPGIRIALRYLRQTFGHVKAKHFGPKALKVVRARMIADGHSRTYVNDNIARIKRCFRWGVEEEMVPGETYYALKALPSLAAGRSAARETEPIEPVDIKTVELTLVHLPRIIADMVQLQLLLGCRPSEILRMRPCEIDRSGDVWIYQPVRHKTEHRGKTRRILIGPKAQKILAPYLMRKPDKFCFCPQESLNWHPRKIREASCRREAAIAQGRKCRLPGKRYQIGSYRLAIIRACKKAGVSPWSPNQLRHAWGTHVRSRFGLEAAQVVLGHTQARVSEIYAERYIALGERVVRAIG